MKALFRSDPLGVATVVIAVCALVAAALIASRVLPAPGADGPPNERPASAELARCRALGADAGADPACHAAWADSRRRFFGEGARP